MKRSFKLTICFFISFVSLLSTGYAQQAAPESSLHVTAVRDPNTGHVRIRWAPKDFKTFKLGNTDGYSIERYTVAISGTYLNFDEIKASRLLLGEFTPYSEADWDNFSANNDIAGVAQAAIFSDDFSPTVAGDLSKILNTNTQVENRLNFGLFAADQSFEVAKLMRLAYIDEEVGGEEIYRYKITAFNEPKPDKPWGATSIDMKQEYVLPEPTGLRVKMEGKVVMIYVPKANLETFYSSYDIQIKGNNGWETRNTSPIVYMGEENQDDMVFTDSVPEYGVEFSYRVVGRSPFEIDAPPSEAVVALAPHPPLGILPDLIACLQDGQSLQLKWEFPKDAETEIHHFAIMRAPEADGLYEQIGEVSVQTRDYSDGSPSPLSNYYKILAIDNHGRENPSLAKLGQVNDEDPPSQPVGLEGKVTKDGLVTLTWAAGLEPDLKGYRVYFSNNKDNDFAQLTGEVLVGTKFETKLELKTLGKKVYYYVLAVDHRENQSTPSQTVSVDRPDIIPPIKPVLHNVNPFPLGVSLEWIQSSSDDVAKHEVQRKYQTDDNWITLHSIPSGKKDSVYLDSMTIGPDPVKYRIVAVDQGGLPAASEQITVVPVRINSDTITNFKIFSSVDGDQKQAKLTWEYGSPDKMREFHIYRSLGNGQPHFYTISKIDMDEVVIDPVTKRCIFLYKDKDIEVGTLYKYRILAKFKTGASSQLSQIKEFKY